MTATARDPHDSTFEIEDGASRVARVDGTVQRELGAIEPDDPADAGGRGRVGGALDRRRMPEDHDPVRPLERVGGGERTPGKVDRFVVRLDDVEHAQVDVAIEDGGDHSGPEPPTVGKLDRESTRVTLDDVPGGEHEPGPIEHDSGRGGSDPAGGGDSDDARHRSLDDIDDLRLDARLVDGLLPHGLGALDLRHLERLFMHEHLGDHGGVLPRSKRFLYSSGIHCPLIVRIPEKWKRWWPAERPGMTVDRIVSFVDMPKTFVSLAGGKVPSSYQGHIFLGDEIEPAPEYHLSFRERADECSDNVRGLRDQRYAYIKNYMPWAPNGQRLRYMWTMAGTRAWEQHYLDGKCNEITGRFFQPRPSEEFYDTQLD